MKHNINIYIVHTEYHLLMAVRVIWAEYKNSNNVVYIAGNRIVNTPDSNDEFVQYVRISEVGYGKGLLTLAKKRNIVRCFFFQENSSDNAYLTYFLSKNSTPIILLQDGLKPYPIWHKKHKFISELKTTWDIYKDMLKHRTLIPRITIWKYGYGFLPWISELWLEFPQTYISNNECSKRTIKTIPALSDDAIEELKRIFNYCSDSLENSILYVEQPLSPNYWDLEVSILKKIIQKFPSKSIYYKKHPNCKNEQVKKVLQETGVIELDLKLPIELVMMASKNSIFLSPYSTAMLTYTDTNRYYWIYLMFSEDGKTYRQMEIVNPTNHIQEINNIDEIN